MRGLKRSEKFEDLVRKLAVEEHPLTRKSIFATIRELMCFAAVLGFQNETRKSVQSSTKIVEGDIIANSQQALDLIYLLALAETQDSDILQNEDEMLQIFEEYAEGGFETLDLWLKERSEDPLGNEAILVAFSKYELLENEVDAETAIGEISFA
jgi:dnd system-associated protein 4